MTTPDPTPVTVPSSLKMPRRRDKPDKPRENYPLFPHQNGQWAKKIRGKLHYFGPWSDPVAAEEQYLDEREYLQAGRTPPPRGVVGCRIQDLVNQFLTTKKQLFVSGELSPLSFQNYYRTGALLVDHFGEGRSVESISVQDFEAFRVALAKTRGLHALGNEINRCRMVFRYAYEQELIEKPIKFGQGFRKPPRKAIKRDRQRKQQQHGLRMFEAQELQRILSAANSSMKAMVLLGINCAFGPTDIANLPQSAIDFKKKWIDFPRPKTAVERRIPLWPETTKALNVAIEQRPTATNTADDELVFITRSGQRYVRVNLTEEMNENIGTVRNSVSERFAALLKKLELKRPGVNFYALRHTFETIAGEARDQVAVDAIMGHSDQSIASVYREKISDERLRDVVNHVRKWVFARTKNQRSS